MEQQSRRNLLKFLGFGAGAAVAVYASGAAAAAAAGYSVGSRKKEVEDAVREINEFGPNTMALHNTYGEIDNTPTPNGFIGWNGKKIVPGTEKQITIPMVPGPDGHMYLKINNEWRRIVTE